jgi:chemotaxis protein histidine kinase CheA
VEKRVTFDSEVTAIARILFSAGEITDGKKTIRDDARYAEKRGEVVIERQQGQGESRPRLYVYRNDFREWAASHWPQLRSHFKLPIVVSINAILPPAQFAGHLIQIPTDHDELVRQFVAATDALMHCQKELAECKKRLEQLEQETANRKNADDLTKQLRQAAGKAGGRGNWKV